MTSFTGSHLEGKAQGKRESERETDRERERRLESRGKFMSVTTSTITDFMLMPAKFLTATCMRSKSCTETLPVDRFLLCPLTLI